MTHIGKSGWLAWLILAALVTTSRAQEGPLRVFVMNVDGGQVRKLAAVAGQGQHGFPRWSHDGKRVAFETAPTGEAKLVRKLFVVNADGSGLRDLGFGSMPYWSQDDKQLAFYAFGTDGKAALLVQNADGQGRTPLGRGKSPCWSPDGSLMASTDGRNVTLTDMATGATRGLFTEPFVEVFRGIRFTPDGKRLALTVRAVEGQPRQLLLADVANARDDVAVRLEANLDGSVSFSPDGKRMACAIDNKICIVEVEGNAAPQPVPGQRGRNYQPDWSPDGKTIVFVSDREEP